MQALPEQMRAFSEQMRRRREALQDTIQDALEDGIITDEELTAIRKVGQNLNMSEEQIEKFVEGKLLAIGMNEKQPMPIIHIQPKSGFYDYEAKYTSGKTEYICPADLTQKETQSCQDTATNVYQVLRGSGIPRVDVILDFKGIPYVLEMNTIPGMTPTSLLPIAAKQSGVEFDDLVIKILKSAQLDYEG